MKVLGRALVRHAQAVRLGAAVFLAAYFALVTLGLGGDRLVHGNIALTIGVLAAAVICWAAATQHAAGDRRMWRLFALAATSWGIGQLIRTYHEVFAREGLPFPSLADVFHLLAVPFAVAAVSGFIKTPTGRLAAVRAVAEGGVIASAVFFLSWAVVLGAVYRSSGDSWAPLIASAYPFTGVLVMTVVTYAAARSRPERRYALLPVGTALVLLALTDSVFSALALKEAYQSGSPVDLGWLCGYVLIGLASLRVESHPTAGNVDNEGRLARLMSFLTLVPLVVMIGTVVGRVFNPREDIVLWWSAVALVSLFVIMQIMVLLENAVLMRHLEARVAARTAAYHRRERFFRSIVQNSSELVTVIDDRFQIIYQTSTSDHLPGELAREAASRIFLDNFDDDGRLQVESVVAEACESPGVSMTIEVTTPLGRHSCQVLELTVVNLLDDPDVEGIVVTTSDITTRKSLEQQLTHQAFHDGLTSLPNRALFRDRVAHALARLEREPDKSLAVLFVDMDEFKSINDSLGHDAGDALLKAFAERTVAVLRPGSTFARLGGDEFAVLIEDCEDAQSAMLVADRILRSLLLPFEVLGREIFVNASIGIAISDVVSSVEDLLRNADVAMYIAKRDGTGRYRLYEPQMHSEAVARLEMESGLRRAVERDEFVLNYQPLVSLQDGSVVGLEALLRWHDPDRGLIPPMDFIPLAEQTGLILPIGHWVLQQACRDGADWYARYGEAAPGISVNLSYRQLQHVDLVDELAQILFDTGLPPARLTLELTESLLAEDPAQVLARLQAIKELGVNLSIDDFGTGYSSLSYLRQFPFDELKIDRRFIAALVSESQDFELVQAILGLGDLFKLSTVAEGIETDEQRQTLQAMGCSTGQGFHFARPMPREQLEAFLEASTFAAGPAV